MKDLKYFLTLVSFVLIFSTCEENGIFFPETAQNTGSFEVTFDGAVFKTSTVEFITENDNIIITAVNSSSNQTFTLSVNNFDLNNFSFEGQNTVGSYVNNNAGLTQDWTTFDETNSRGSIEFTNIDFVNNTVSGVFNFIGRNASGNSKAFTNGTFTNVPKALF